MTIFCDLGIQDYAKTWALQRRLVTFKKERIEAYDYLIVVEHPEVITVGRRYHDDSISGAIEVERGGEATVHNLGQLVFYPVLTLAPPERDIHLYLRRLEEVLLGVLEVFGVNGMRKPGSTGVWVSKKNKKIASVGVAVSNWVTYHGCALNVSNDLNAFEKIRPCGMDWRVMTSLEQELGAVPPRMEVIRAFQSLFEGVFSRRLDCGAALELLSFNLEK